MFAWLQRSVPFVGSALFQGTWPLRKDSFDHLRARGIEMSDGEANEGWHWSLDLKHPQWGEATLVSSRTVSPPPLELIEWDGSLNPDEVEEIKRCGSTVQLMMESKKNHILRDRKNALQFLNAVVGEDGLAAMDHVGQKIWSREALAIETTHSADLDVDGIMTYHWVTDENDNATWVHSHGLGEIGCYDFDILNASPDLQGRAHDLLRCIAFHSVEGEVKPGAVIRPLSTAELSCVPVTDFMAKAAVSHRELRDDPSGDHSEKRVVLCDVRGGVLSSLLGAKPHPSKVLSSEYDERNLIQFSTAATELMSERARASFDFFVGLVREMAAIRKEIPAFEATPALKLGYRTDNASDESDREHMWFEFHGVEDGKIDATLLNQPFNIARMKEGDRGLHALELLTDWTIFTPVAPITPSNSRSLRFIRKNLDKLREALAEGEAEAAS